MEEMKLLANIPLDVLIDVAKKEGKTREEIKEEFRRINRENVHEIFRYIKFDDDFADTISIYNNGGVIGYTTASYTEFLTKLATILKLPKREKYIDNEAFDEEITKALEKFKDAIILGKAQIYNEYNLIYRDIQNGKNYLKEVQEKYVKGTKEYQEKEQYFYRCALNRRYEIAIDKQKELYTRLVEKRRDYKKLIESKPQGAFILENFDVYKMAMFIMYGYLEFCNRNNNLQTLRMYEKLVKKYINAPGQKDIVVELADGGFIDYNTILQGYLMLTKKIAKLDIKMPFELLPKGKKEKSDENDDELDEVIEDPTPTTRMSEEERLRLQKLGREKTDFYEGTDYIARAKGTEMFNGYIAYFYPNGRVILDRKYEERSPSTAYGSASYHFKTMYFELLSGMDKTSLKKIPMRGKINHTETWKERTMKVINEDGTQEEIDAANMLLNKLREQQENAKQIKK